MLSPHGVKLGRALFNLSRQKNGNKNNDESEIYGRGTNKSESTKEISQNAIVKIADTEKMINVGKADLHRDDAVLVVVVVVEVVVVVVAVRVLERANFPTVEVEAEVARNRPLEKKPLHQLR